MKLKSLFILFVAGMVAGTVLDAFHVAVGVARYTSPVLFQQAWWVPLIFGAATVLIGVSHWKLHPMPGNHPHRREAWTMAFLGSFLFFVLSYLVTAGIPPPGYFSAFIVLVFYLISWGVFDRTLTSVVLALITAVIGCSVESGLGRLGQYHYASPDFFRIPAWLPALYLNVSAAVGFLGRLLLSTVKERDL